MKTRRLNAAPSPEGQHTVPGDGYAAQHARGFRWLRFSPLLEAEYLAHMRFEQRLSALVCTATALAIWTLLLVFDLVRLDWWEEFRNENLQAIAVAATRLTTFAALAGLAIALAGRWLPASYHYLSLLALVLLGFSAGLSANFYDARGIAHIEMAEFAIIMAAFLPIGLSFRQSVLAATGVVGAVVLASFLPTGQADLGPHLYLALMLLFAGFVGSVGAYLREHAEREQFLLRRLLHHRAMFDPLTGIGNRRFFDEQAAVALRQARRDRAELFFALLDVDHFKKYNDHYGHHAGDVALRALAQATRACLRRPLDVTARLGGEEFGLIIYGAERNEAERILDMVMRRIAALTIPHEPSPTAQHLTVSIGAARFDGQESIDDLYLRADRLLYEAKAAGRNRVLLDDSALARGAANWSRRNGAA